MGTFPLLPSLTPLSARSLPNLASSSVLQCPAGLTFLWNVRLAPGCQLFSETVSLFCFRIELWCCGLSLVGCWETGRIIQR